jgi:Transposase and inactivated derivatives
MDYRRFYQPGARYFFTVVTDGRQPLLIDHIERLRDAFRLGMSRQPFAVEAIVVLPDHLHTIWRLPEGDADFSTRWMIIKRKFSAGIPMGRIRPSQCAKRERGIWQRRFWEHYLRDEADWQRHVDYIHYNPVKHGYVARAGDWPYSSFHRAVAAGSYPADGEPGTDPKLPHDPE